MPAPWTPLAETAAGRSSPARARWRCSPWRCATAARSAPAVSAHGAGDSAAELRAWNSYSSSSRRKRACNALLSSLSPWSAAAHSAKNLRAWFCKARPLDCVCAVGRAPFAEFLQRRVRVDARHRGLRKQSLLYDQLLLGGHRHRHGASLSAGASWQQSTVRQAKAPSKLRRGGAKLRRSFGNSV